MSRRAWCDRQPEGKAAARALASCCCASSSMRRCMKVGGLKLPQETSTTGRYRSKLYPAVQQRPGLAVGGTK
jgi:hypothetical protein